jgi:ankyrin repeat protein
MISQRSACRPALRGLVAVFSLVHGVFGVPQAAKKVDDAHQVVDMGTFKVSAPPGKWSVQRPPQVPVLTFVQLKGGLLNQLANQQRGLAITVAAQRLAPHEWFRNEREAADLQIDVWAAIEANVPSVSAELVDKGEIQIGDKRVYYVKFVESYPGQDLEADMNIHFYFPPTFKKQHRFFCFQFSFTHSLALKPCNNPGTEPLAAVIGSLEIVDPLQTVAGPTGDLLRASAEGALEAVRQAVANGASVGVSTAAGTPLSLAALHGRGEIVEFLLDQGADLNAADEEEGATPLVTSLVGGEPEIAGLLVGRGADVNIPTKKGFTPLMYAVCMRLGPLVPLLIDQGAAVNAKTDKGETPLIFAAQAGSAELAQLLLDRGAEIDIQTTSGCTALMEAADSRHADVARMLVDRGADVNLRSNTGWTALLVAIDRGQPELAAILIGQGADVNAASDTGWTPLMESAESDDAATAKLLLDKGAGVNAKTDKKMTALKIAKRKKNVELVRLLQAAGAK